MKLNVLTFTIVGNNIVRDHIDRNIKRYGEGY